MEIYMYGFGYVLSDLVGYDVEFEVCGISLVQFFISRMKIVILVLYIFFYCRVI